MRFLKFVIILLIFLDSIIFGEAIPLKNIVSIEGLIDNPLIGYGLVTGLKGTGDSDKTPVKDMLSSLADNFGFSIDPSKIKPKNTAIVLVSGTINPLCSPGSRIDVKVSSIYDAKSLEGGELVVTPLVAGDNKIYAIAEGKIIVDPSSKGVKGYILNGGIVQAILKTEIFNSKEISLIIDKQIGLSGIATIKEEINNQYPDSIISTEGNRIKLKIPENKDIYSFIKEIYNLKVNIDDEASIIIDSKTGLIVYGGNIILSECAISYKGTEINISNPLFTDMQSKKETTKLLPSSTTVATLVEGLNEIGATPDDIIKILHLLKENGSLKAKLIVK